MARIALFIAIVLAVAAPVFAGPRQDDIQAPRGVSADQAPRGTIQAP
jgi:hypothetical protein